MVNLNALLEMLDHVMHRIRMVKPLVYRRFDRRWECIGTVSANLGRSQQGLVLQHLAQKPVGCIQIALCGQPKIERISCFVYGPVRVALFAADLYVGLIDAHRAAMSPTKLTPPLFNHWRLGQNPTVDRVMIDLESALAKHIFPIPIVERITQIPTEGLHNQPCLGMSALEVIFRLTLPLFGNGIEDHRYASQLWERNFSSDGRHRVKRENLRQARSNVSSGE